MDKRQETILEIIVKEHIKTTQPIASNMVAEKYKISVSPATIRNDMAELENEGYIMQPYTSAGRIPTEKGYNFYITNLSEKSLASNLIEVLNNSLKTKDEMSLKQTAKELANLSGLAVFWAFHRHNLYYTGLSNLLQQPEFAQPNLIYDVSAIIDRLEEVIDKIFDKIEVEPTIYLGSNNPFGNFCSSIMAKYKLGDNIGLVGILGPLRMDYEKNLALIKFIKNKL